MPRHIIAAIFIVTGLIIPLSADARLSVAQAEVKCLKRVSTFARLPYGRFGGAPAPTKIRDEYRACVYGYARAYPVRQIEVRGSRVRFAQ